MKTTPADEEEMIQTVVALEAIHTSLGKLSSAKPLSIPMAQAFEITITHFCKRVGYDKPRLFALEQFLGKPSRIQATKVALEGVVETIRHIVAKIIAWIRKTMVHVFDLMLDAYRGAKSFGAQAQMVETKALDTKAKYGNQRLTAVFSKQSFVEFFAGSGFTEAGQIGRAYQQHVHVFNNNFSHELLGKAATYLSSVTHEVLRLDKSDIFTRHQAASVSDAAIRWLQENTLKTFVMVGEEGLYKLPFGEMQMTASFTKNDDLYVGMGIIMKRMDREDESNVSLDILTPDEVMLLSRMVDSSVRSGIFSNYVAIKNHLSHISKTLSDCCDEINRRQAYSGSGAVTSLHFLKLITESLIKITVFAYDYSRVVNKNLIAYCEASLKAYQQPSL